MSFFEEYETLRTQDKNTFAQVCNTLLFRCYLVRKRYDRTTGMDKFQADYAFCERHFSLFEEYLGYMDVVLVKDDDSGVIFVRNEEDRNTVRFNTNTTLIIFALRIYYEAAIKERPNNLEVHMDSNILRQQLSDLGLSNTTRRISIADIQQAMKTLSQYNIVVNSKGTFNDNTFSFYILPSIKFIIDRDRINSLYRYLSGDSGPESDEDEEEKLSPEVDSPFGDVSADSGASEDIDSGSESEDGEDSEDGDDEAPAGF